MAAVLDSLHPKPAGGLPQGVHQDFQGRLGLVFDSPKLETARRLRDDLVRDFTDRAPEAGEPLEEGFDDAVTVMVLPGRYRKRLRTINCLERLNEEICRLERVIRIFPNEESRERQTHFR